MEAISKTPSFEYLGYNYFAVTFVLAVILHLMAFLGYNMMPHIRIIDIPVRALNIRLGDSDVQQIQEEEQDQQPISANSKQVESVIEKLVRKTTEEKIVKKAPVPVPVAPKIKEAISPAFKTPEFVDKSNSPRQFVRAMPAEKNDNGIDGSILGNSADSKAIIKTRYEQTISLWIRKFKLYPDSARSGEMQGNTVVRIRIDRRGNIRYSALEVSTGYEELDRAALDMVRRANPVPAVPESYPDGEMFEFLIPVSFKLSEVGE